MVRSISSDGFVGRADELVRLRSALERATTGVPVAVVVAGEAGVGKSRLVAEFTGWGEAAGAVVLAGSCLNVGDGLLPYAPVVEALRALAGSTGRDRLEVALGDARPELARLVPELGPSAANAVTTVPGRLFELLLGVLHRLAEQGPVVFVVEDLHWADRSTRDLIEFLVRNLRAGVVLTLTYRSDEMDRRHPLRSFLAELDRVRHVERLALRPFDREELVDFVAAKLGRPPPPDLVADILARSQGNPFFAEELLAAPPEAGELPAALRDLLLVRVEALPEEAQQVLRVASAGGSRVDHRLLAAVAAVPEPQLIGSLREAVSAHLLVVAADHDAYRFWHALVQEALYDDLLPGERSALHAGYARALAARRAAGQDRPGDLGHLAFHWGAAHEAGPALVASVEAGLAAEATYALAEAGVHYERALALLDGGAPPEAARSSPLDRTELLRRAAHAAMLTGQPVRAVELAGRALTHIDREREPLRSGAVLERLGRYRWMSGDSEGAMASLRQAVAVIPAEPPSWERARALAALGQLLMLGARYPDAAAHCEQAIAVARTVGAKAEEGHARTSLGVSLFALGHRDEGLEQMQLGRRIAEELGDPEEVCRADHNTTGCLLDSGRAEDALARARSDREVAVRLGSARTYGLSAVAHAAEALVLLGRWDEAERLLADEADLTVPAGDAISRSRAHALLARGALRLVQGHLTEATADLHAVRMLGRRGLDPQTAAPLFASLIRTATWAGRLDDARAAITDGLALLDGCDDAALITLVGAAGIEAEATAAEAARALHSGRDLDLARRSAGELLARLHMGAEGRQLNAATAAHLLTAEAEWSRIDSTGDPDRWASAATAWDDLGFPFPAAYARFRRTEALLAAGGPRAPASATLRHAWTIAHRLRAGWLEHELTALAGRARIALDPEPRSPQEEPTPPPSAAHGLGLTPRELEVLALVAEGRTNRQIARTLYISDKTASVHVSHILGKLGVANRAAAATAAHRLRLTND